MLNHEIEGFSSSKIEKVSTTFFLDQLVQKFIHLSTLF